LSHKPHLIAPSETMRADEIAIKTAKTSKVTALVAVMSVFSKKDASCGALIAEMRSLLAKNAESANIPEGNTRRSRSLSQKLRKGQMLKKLAPKLKKLRLNCTNLKLNSKKTHSDCAKAPDSSISSGLNVKNKTIRVLLNSGLSGDLLFMKKRSSKRISVVKRVVPQSWGTSNGTFITDRVGDIEISFVEYLASKKVHLQPDIVEDSLGD
jgi:hypothetical protein